MLKQIIILLLIFVIPFNSVAQKDQRYSVDKKMAQHHFIKLNLKHLFKKRSKQQKADDLKEKQRYKETKEYNKGLKKYQKKLNKGKRIGTQKPGYVAMRKNKRLSKRVNNDKPKGSWFKRNFKNK